MNDSFRQLRVARKNKLTADITLFELSHPNSDALEGFTPGSHVTVITPNGMRRSYSLCGATDQTHTWQIAIKRDANGRGGSRSMVDDVHEGDLLQVSAAHNLFQLNEAAASFIFIAGGIGITPILSMIRHLHRQGRTNYKLYYCTRDADSTAFLDELTRPDYASQVNIHHNNNEPEKSLDLWPIFEQPTQAHVYCCGPQSLMDSVRDMTGHWPTERIHFESFGTENQIFSENVGFDLVLNKTGACISVDPQQSILQALRAHGHAISSSCESGTCGACRTNYISGEIEHRDLVLRPDEQAHQIMVCVSRAKSGQLVLDL